MKKEHTITIIVILIALTASVAAGFGIFSDFGNGPYEYESIRGLTIDIYGKGIYRHMSADVAIQGIAQDYITLYVAIPILLISLTASRKGSVRAQFMLSGTLGYFLVTYLFYLSMGMYNTMFLLYALLLGLTFFALFLNLKQLSQINMHAVFSESKAVRFVGWFLVVNAVAIAFLWLGIIIPPLIDGSIYPPELNHYTTLIVQGFDLGLLLPVCFVVGLRLIKRKSDGYLYATSYIVFLAFLMTALTAKIIAMAINDVNVIPVIFIIPVINITTIVSAVLMISNIRKQSDEMNSRHIS